MIQAPLPQPSDPVRLEAVADVLSSVIEGRSGMYVSLPITSGRRFLEWYTHEGRHLPPESVAYATALRRSVITPNIDFARRQIEELRIQFRRVIVNPAAFDRPEWTQDDYRYFWGQLIERFIDTVVFVDGWQLSSGCAYEFLRAQKLGLKAISEAGELISRSLGSALIAEAIKELEAAGVPTHFLSRIWRDLRAREGTSEDLDQASTQEEAAKPPDKRMHYKDAVLDQLATVSNVAQFISFSPGEPSAPRYSRVHGCEANRTFDSLESAVQALLDHSPEGEVNVRSFRPEQPTGEPLVYGLCSSEKVAEVVRARAAQGLFTIVNETVNVSDGGVSGVLMGDVIEFAPETTPQCVDHPGICSLPRNIGVNLLQQVYGFRPNLNFEPGARVEFSLHPRRRGLRSEHTIIWEIESVGSTTAVAQMQWPNSFSRFLGDKVFGLLVAEAMGLPVPSTTALSRKIAPFAFGRSTGTGETWLRTCPEVRSPGKYVTTYGWQDPFEILSRHQNERRADEPRIVSVLAQEGVNALFSGSLLPLSSGELIVEGVAGRGDDFMLGRVGPERLPREVESAVQRLYSRAAGILGPVEIEWVFDGSEVWVVQLHRTGGAADAGIIFEGEASSFEEFDVRDGLESLRARLPILAEEKRGIVLLGDVGLTSHFGDLLRGAKVPSRLQRDRGVEGLQ